MARYQSPYPKEALHCTQEAIEEAIAKLEEAGQLINNLEQGQRGEIQRCLNEALRWARGAAENADA